MKGQAKLLITQILDWIMPIPNGENVVANNLNYGNFFFFEKCQNWLQKQSSYVIFSEECHICLQSKTPHVVHLTYEYWINHNFSCRYGFILYNNFYFILFYFFDVFWELRELPRDQEKQWGQLNFFFTTPSWIFFPCLKGTTLFQLTQKFQKLINVFDNVRAYPNFQKTHLKTLVL
jgi:hypothetical protein